MKNLIKRVYFINIILLILFFNVGCHPDNSYFTNKEVKKYCDFDMSKTEYKISKLNNGKYVLVDKRGFKVYGMNDNDVVGNDTCYIKMIACKWWENSVVRD